ncbi:MAG: GPP34 family phosphoprotein [bacterium]
MLTLPEELLLLALDDEKGKTVGSAAGALPFGLAGALIFELHLSEQIALRGKNVTVTDNGPLDDEILDLGLRHIRDSKKVRSLDYWIGSLSSKIRDLQQRIIDRLISKGILKQEEQRVLWVFPVQRYPTDDPRTESDVRKRIRSVILHGKQPDLRTVLLLSLVKACNLIPEVFRKDEVEHAKERIEHLTQKEPVGEAITHAVQAVQAAVIASIMASTVMTTAISTR